MASRWLVIRVDLLQGRGETFDPSPGRVMLAAGSMTFDALGRAIDIALGRWDHAHLRRFRLPDGTEVTDPETAQEVTGSGMMPTIPRMAHSSDRLSKHLKKGTEFTYVFDFGDDWLHACTVEAYADPLEEYGAIPDNPVPIWGWGNLPDQYGRRWDDDDGVSDPPPPVRAGSYNHLLMTTDDPELVDLSEVRRTIATGDAGKFLDAVTAREIGSALQQVGGGCLTLWQQATRARRARLDPVLLSVLNRLEFRGWEGDSVLANELLAALRGEDLPGRALPVDLDSLAMYMHDSEDPEGGCYLNTVTGEVIPAIMSDPAMVGEDATVDVESDEWVFVDADGSHAWHDMADFADMIREPQQRTRLTEALDGKGAFSRFRRVVSDLDLRDAWHAYAQDRQLGRARALLVEHGIRVA